MLNLDGLNMHDIKKLRENSEPIAEYLTTPSTATEAFNKRLQEYTLTPTIIEKLKSYAGKVFIFSFSAEWCKDCRKNVPVLKLIQDVTGIEVRVLGHIMRDAKNPYEIWRIPPSPPEVKEFNVTSIPHIVVLDAEGNELGAVIENPPLEKTLEAALLEILETI
jgi:thiol-disulfide isomerase/thioredoxin